MNFKRGGRAGSDKVAAIKLCHAGYGLVACREQQEWHGGSHGQKSNPHPMSVAWWPNVRNGPLTTEPGGKRTSVSDPMTTVGTDTATLERVVLPLLASR